MNLENYSTDQLYDLREDIEEQIRIKKKENQRKVYHLYWLDGEILFKKYSDLVEWITNVIEREDEEILCSITISKTFIEESYYNKQPDAWDL